MQSIPKQKAAKKRGPFRAWNWTRVEARDEETADRTTRADARMEETKLFILGIESEREKSSSSRLASILTLCEEGNTERRKPTTEPRFEIVHETRQKKDGRSNFATTLIK
jgi:hypothetical protein